MKNWFLARYSIQPMTKLWDFWLKTASEDLRNTDALYYKRHEKNSRNELIRNKSYITQQPNKFIFIVLQFVSAYVRNGNFRYQHLNTWKLSEMLTSGDFYDRILMFSFIMGFVLQYTVLLLIFTNVFLNVGSHPIKNVVVLMLENRSFDHILGYMKQTWNK